jgi:hypothetical protein
MNLSTALRTAFARSLYLAVGTFLLSLLVGHEQGLGWDAAATAAGITALGPLVGRGVAEGIYDQQRADTNDQKPGDVGYGRLPTRRP